MDVLSLLNVNLSNIIRNKIKLKTLKSHNFYSFQFNCCGGGGGQNTISKIKIQFFLINIRTLMPGLKS